jgi:hypothetical protein
MVMLGDELLLIMISLVGANHLRIGQRANGSSDDEILLRRELSGGTFMENRPVLEIEPKRRPSRKKGPILPNTVEDSTNEAVGSHY